MFAYELRNTNGGRWGGGRKVDMQNEVNSGPGEYESPYFPRLGRPPFRSSRRNQRARPTLTRSSGFANCTPRNYRSREKGREERVGRKGSLVAAVVAALGLDPSWKRKRDFDELDVVSNWIRIFIINCV